jgi:very-short-patch-repair endonuclease
MNFQQLLPLLAIVAFIFVLAAIIRLFASKGRGSFPYERIERLFTPAERSFLGVLEEVIGKEYVVLGKVRLADIIRPRKGLTASARTSALNRITSKHVDFAVCDLRTRAVVGIVELDDSSHQNVSRQRRDEFIDKALSAAGVPVVHVAAQKAYQPSELRGQIAALFAQTGGTRSNEARRSYSF